MLHFEPGAADDRDRGDGGVTVRCSGAARLSITARPPLSVRARGCGGVFPVIFWKWSGRTADGETDGRHHHGDAAESEQTDRLAQFSAALRGQRVDATCQEKP